MSTAIVVRPPDSLLLPDNAQYTNRFKIKSESSGDFYIVAQHKTAVASVGSGTATANISTPSDSPADANHTRRC
jgi:hypothetical protein